MGFIRANVIPILKEHGRRPFSGTLLTLGMPDVYFTYEHLLRMAQTVNVPLDTSVEITASHRDDFAAKGYISGETLFKSIGIERTFSLDYSSFEGADFEFDLNVADLPQDLRGRFDVVCNHGTMEHIFHTPNVLNNIFNMLPVGGRVIHSAPSSNTLDHGFYMFSPTFFYDFYTANKWEINSLLVIMMSPRQETEPFFYTEYEPGYFGSVSYGGLTDAIYTTLCIATKKEESTGCVIPQQGLYSRQEEWQKDDPCSPETTEERASPAHKLWKQMAGKFSTARKIKKDGGK